MVFSVPWLDGPVALAAVMEHSGDDDAGDDGRARSGARTGAGREDVGRDRSSVGGTAGRRGRARARRPTTTRPSASTSRNGGSGSTRRSARCGRCGAQTVRRSSAASTRPRAVAWNPGRRNRAGHRSGWAAGAPTPGFVAWPVSPTAGWHRRTTRRRSCSARRGRPSLEAGRSREGRRHVPERAGDDVVLHHRRPRRSRPHPQRAGDSHRAPARGDAPRTSPDRPARTVRREVDRVRARRACNASSSGRSPTRCDQLERFWNEVRPLGPGRANPVARDLVRGARVEGDVPGGIASSGIT